MEHGFILKKLRIKNNYSIKEAAKQINKSVGWLSEIENNKGNAKLQIEEFNRIVTIYDGNKYRRYFYRWKSIQSNDVLDGRVFEGATLRHLRKKQNLSLKLAANKVGFSKGHLSNIELSRVKVNKKTKLKLLKIYGHNYASFRNYLEEGKFFNCIPAKYKLQILSQYIDNDLGTKIFNHILAELRSR